MTKAEATRLGDVLTLSRRAERVAPRVWAVPSRSEPEVRIVNVWPAAGAVAARCDCPAGEHRRACVHIAAVLLRLSQRRPAAAVRLAGVPLGVAA